MLQKSIANKNLVQRLKVLRIVIIERFLEADANRQVSRIQAKRLSINHRLKISRGKIARIFLKNLRKEKKIFVVGDGK